MMTNFYFFPARKSMYKLVNHNSVINVPMVIIAQPRSEEIMATAAEPAEVGSHPTGPVEIMRTLISTLPTKLYLF